MTPLPVIVGFGGFNAAGRSSFHQAYLRMVIESIELKQRRQVIAGLATMMNHIRAGNDGYYDDLGKKITVEALADIYSNSVLDSTLVRKITDDLFDADHIPSYKHLSLSPDGNSKFRFQLRKKDLPNPIPENWHVTDLGSSQIAVSVVGNLNIKVPTTTAATTQSAGQLPTGFNPSALYNSRFHPRGLQMAIVGASDAINSVGIGWQDIMKMVSPDQVAVYASSAMGQMDEYSNSGFLQARLKGSRVSAKQLALGFTSMPADFINAYIIGNLGVTGSMTGACASLLYNLRAGIEDIKAGRRRIVIVGGSEAPLTSEIIEGYEAMSALATDKRLRELDNADTTNHRRASRPFGQNCGFTLGESTQYFVLMDDELAIATGANIYAAVNDVFVNADGYKRSISSPGAGNYITLAKALAAARSVVGERSIQCNSFIQAHGSSTPQNRVTESIILNKVAAAFDIQAWPVTAVKSYVGHSLGTASGDQLAMTLGVFAHNLIPGIKTIDKIADDVIDDQLSILTTDTQSDQPLDVALINAKGFGGNNASASVLSPAIVDKMLTKRHGKKIMTDYRHRSEVTQTQAENYNEAFIKGDYQTIYRFGEQLIDEDRISIDNEKIKIPSCEQDISLDLTNPFSDMV